MQTTKRSEGLGRRGATGSAEGHGSVLTRKRAKRNPWVVVGFFWLVIAAWINSQM